MGLATLTDVQAVYSGPEGRLWELVMGQQIHIGGLQSSTDLATRAGIGGGMRGVDFCCCTGAGMRFLLRMQGVEFMTGVDATAAMVELGRRRCSEEGFADRTKLVLADVCATGLESGSVDFVWGEDAWCYVEDKPSMIAEAARLVKPGGIIAFTDWVDGPAPMSADERARFLAFMKFPNMQSIAGYSALLAAQGCDVLVAEDTGRFAPHVALYINMLTMQLTYDALKIIDFDGALMQALAGEMVFTRGLADERKLAQGIFIARKRL